MTRNLNVSDQKQNVISGYLHKLSYFEISWNVRYVQFDGKYIRYFNESNGKLKGEIEVLNAVAFDIKNGTVIFGFDVIGSNKEKMSFGVLDESIRNKWLFDLNMKTGNENYETTDEFNYRSLELCVCAANQKCLCNIVSRKDKRSSVFTSKTKRSIISVKSVDSGPSPSISFHVGYPSEKLHCSSDRTDRSHRSFWSKPRRIVVEVPISDILNEKINQEVHTSISNLTH